MQNRNLKYFPKLVSNYSSSREVQRQPASMMENYKLTMELANLSERRKEKITDNCIHLSFLQQNLVTLFSGCGAIVHPKRADFVANTNELLDRVNLKFLLFKMKAHPCGK